MFYISKNQKSEFFWIFNNFLDFSFIFEFCPFFGGNICWAFLKGDNQIKSSMSQISGSGDPRVQISPNFGCTPYGPCRIDCVGQPAASSKKKLSDFHKITSYGSVQVSGAQISNFFEIGSLEPEIGTKTCPKMAHFLPKVKIVVDFQDRRL